MSTSACPSYVFQEPTVIATLTISGLCVVIYAVIAALWFKWRRTHQSVRSVLPAGSFGIVILFALLAYILTIIYIPVYFCGESSTHALASFELVTRWLQNISDLTVFVLVALPMTSAVAHASGSTHRRSRTASLVMIILLVLLTVASLIINTITVASSFGRSLTLWYGGSVQEIISSTLIGVYLIAALFVGIVLLSKSSRGRNASSSAGALKSAASLTVVALMAARILVALDWFGWYIGGLRDTDASLTSFMVLETLLLTGTALGLVFTAKSLAQTTAPAVKYSDAHSSMGYDQEQGPVMRV